MTVCFHKHKEDILSNILSQFDLLLRSDHYDIFRKELINLYLYFEDYWMDSNLGIILELLKDFKIELWKLKLHEDIKSSLTTAEKRICELEDDTQVSTKTIRQREKEFINT